MRNLAKLFFLPAALLLVSGCVQDGRRDVEEISTHIRSILELPTFEHIYRDVVFLDRERSFLIFKTMDAEVLFAIDVRIQAGIDLSEGFSVNRTRREGITVTLPPAKILLADADETSIHQYFLKEIGGGISRLDYYDEISKKKTAIVEDAVERGILKRADENARSLIQGFLEYLKTEPVTVVTGKGRTQ